MQTPIVSTRTYAGGSILVSLLSCLEAIFFWSFEFMALLISKALELVTTLGFRV